MAMELLGHAQISTTMNLYAHVAPEVQRDAAERVSQALWGRVSRVAVSPSVWLSNWLSTAMQFGPPRLSLDRC